MLVTKIEFTDFCNDNTTVMVACEAKTGKADVFYVQTVDLKYRQSLGCWITADSSRGEEIDVDDYSDFDIKLIIEKAENFITSKTKITHIRDGYYLRESWDSSCQILKKNNNFVSADWNNYEKEYDVIENFDSAQEANNKFRSSVDYYEACGPLTTSTP